ncbi:MAG: WecB/TagA/CpsF family glycosyltransferase [Symploca sp. SIO2B6]|nr:WecB/TagA/CpsF family glycosyltransferase [Symploca sp. SIO2B6]
MANLLPKLKQGGVVFTPNVDHLMRLRHDPSFQQVYEAATYRTCDSQVLIYASRLLGTPVVEKLSGSDLFPAFYMHYAKDEEVKVFLLGAEEGVAATAQQKINEKVGREMVVGAHSPSFGFEKDEEECAKIIEMIEASGANVLAVGVGSPKQENWICAHKDKFKNITLFLAIGATIDFEAGHVARAPKWISEVGLEWLFRLLSEPRRLWKRYILSDLPFVWLFFKELIKRDRTVGSTKHPQLDANN